LLRQKLLNYTKGIQSLFIDRFESPTKPTLTDIINCPIAIAQQQFIATFLAKLGICGVAVQTVGVKTLTHR
jgi:hypothetical protein